MNILIVGTAGQFGRILTDELLIQTTHRLVLYARNADSRFRGINAERVKIHTGDFEDKVALIKSMDGIDFVYINDLGDDQATATVIEAMHIAGVSRVIAASVLGIYDEVPGASGKWDKKTADSPPRIKSQITSALAIENSGLDYTLLRLTWLYNQEGNKAYILTQKGEPFRGPEVTREAVAQLIIDIITASDDRFVNKCIGVW